MVVYHLTKCNEHRARYVYVASQNSLVVVSLTKTFVTEVAQDLTLFTKRTVMNTPITCNRDLYQPNATREVLTHEHFDACVKRCYQTVLMRLHLPASHAEVHIQASD